MKLGVCAVISQLHEMIGDQMGNDPAELRKKEIFQEFCISAGQHSSCCFILENTGDAFFAVDTDRKIRSFFNRAATRLTGYASQEALGRHCFDVLRSSICLSDCPAELAFRTAKSQYDRQAKIIAKNGTEIPVSISVAPVVDESGHTVGVVEIVRDLSPLEKLRNLVSGKYKMGDMISKNASMQAIFEMLPDIAESDSSVLIHGSSGSGKGILARAIHQMSLRKDRPFVHMNCGALPDTLLESELFGYIRGAFTDARKSKPGRFAAAHEGTLFLDEVATMSPALQVKLLRVLEDGEYTPLGATLPVRSNVRIISATNQDLQSLVAGGTFREDLYYRLNVIKIQLPPLRERREDIPLLVDRFLARFNALKGKSITGVSQEVMSVLMNHGYPGNIRELENIVEHAHVLCHESIIQFHHLPCEFTSMSRSSPLVLQPGDLCQPLGIAEAEVIRKALVKQKGSRTGAARELGISRSTLWRKRKRYGLA